MTTALMAPVGRNGRNLPDDVKKVQELLNDLHPSADVEVNGVCDDTMIQVIRKFQATFMSEIDGRVDPNGRTLRRLDLISQLDQTVRKYKVPEIAQANENICWEASARMLWAYRNGAAAPFPPGVARSAWEANKNRGLTHTEMTVFYRLLGIRVAPRSRSGGLLRTIPTCGPVIFTSVDKVSGHAMVATGYDLQRAVYFVINPAALTRMTFDDDVIDVGPGASSSASARPPRPSHESVSLSAGSGETSFRAVEQALGPSSWMW
jgi:hypothetical protein